VYPGDFIVIKKGQLSNAEKGFIRANATRMKPVQIAEKLSRSEKQVLNYLTEHSLLPVAASGSPGEEPESNAAIVEARHKLRQTMAWRQLNEELDDNELLYFEEKYAQYMTQFREDVLVTEETQIFLVIKLEIMMHRNSKSKRNAAGDIARLSSIRDKFLRKFDDPSDMSESDREYVMSLETQIQACKSAEAARSTEFIKLEEKHQALLKDLKATRDQRVSRVESSRETFLGTIKRLQNEDEREFAGRHMELLRNAADRENKRLGSAHTFEDGAEDLPVLNAETILSDD
jgi:hypothetical protein